MNLMVHNLQLGAYTCIVSHALASLQKETCTASSSQLANHVDITHLDKPHWHFGTPWPAMSMPFN